MYSVLCVCLHIDRLTHNPSYSRVNNRNSILSEAFDPFIEFQLILANWSVCKLLCWSEESLLRKSEQDQLLFRIF